MIAMETTAKIKQRTLHTQCVQALCPVGRQPCFKGIKGCIPMLHGSQGCATYIRRYMISHYKNLRYCIINFSEDQPYTEALKLLPGFDNVIKQYNPEVIGIASTCLSEPLEKIFPGSLRNTEPKH
jgi:nitrogenase molybdenum-iron protein NifN